MPFGQLVIDFGRERGLERVMDESSWGLLGPLDSLLRLSLTRLLRLKDELFQRLVLDALPRHTQWDINNFLLFRDQRCWMKQPFINLIRGGKIFLDINFSQFQRWSFFHLQLIGVYLRNQFIFFKVFFVAKSIFKRRESFPWRWIQFFCFDFLLFLFLLLLVDDLFFFLFGCFLLGPLRMKSLLVFWKQPFMLDIYFMFIQNSPS